MKFTAVREAILPALETAARITPARSHIPILGHVLLKADAGGLVAKASNLDQETTLRLPAGEDLVIVEPGETTVPAAMLRDIVKRARAGAQVTLTQDAGSATVVSGRARFVLPALPASDMPVMDGPSADAVAIHIAPALLARLLSVPWHAISTEESRYYLNGIFLHVRDDKLAAVATNGHCLTLYRPHDAPSEPGRPGIIVPMAACDPIARLAASAPAARIETNGRKLKVSFGEDLIFVTKLIDGTFPDYQRVIPLNPPAVATLDRAETTEALGRALLAGAKSRAVRLRFEGGWLTISARNEDTHGSDTVEVTGDRDFETGVNAAYLADVLGLFEGDRVTLRQEDPRSPLLWLADASPDITCVIMPLRV